MDTAVVARADKMSGWMDVWNLFTNNDHTLWRYVGNHVNRMMNLSTTVPTILDNHMMWRVWEYGREREVCCSYTYPTTIQISTDSQWNGPQVANIDGSIHVSMYRDGLLHGPQRVYGHTGVLALQLYYNKNQGPSSIRQWIHCKYLNPTEFIERVQQVGLGCVDPTHPGTSYNVLVTVDNMNGNMKMQLSRGGTIICRCPVVAGLLHGTVKWYRYNILKSMGTVKSGYLHGPWFEWEDNGMLKHYGNWNVGKPR